MSDLINSTARPKKLVAFLVVIISAGLLCLSLFRAEWWLGDEGIVLRGASELLAGVKIYNDFFAFYPPGSYLLVEGWMKVFGYSFFDIRCLSVLIIVGIAGFSYLSILSVSESAVLSAFLTLGWLLTLTSEVILPVSHHWMTTLLSMSAFWFTSVSIKLDKNNTKLPLLVGMLAGASCMTTSSRGTLTVFAVLASYVGQRKYVRSFVYCFLSIFIVPLACLAYIVVNDEFVQAFKQIVVFTLTQYSSVTKVPFGYEIHWYYPNLYLFPLAALLSAWMLVRKFRNTVSDPLFRVCAFYCVAGFVGAFPRPDAFHVAFVGPFSLPLVGYCLSKITSGWSVKWRGIALALGVAWCLPGAIGLVHKGLTVSQKPVIATPNGNIAILGYQKDGGKELFQFLAAANPRDKFFFYPYMPMVPYLAQRRQVSRYDIFIPEYTTKAQYYEACQDVVGNADWVVLDLHLMKPKTWVQIFPGMSNPSPPETQAFERVLQQNFQFARDFGVFEVRRRTGTADAAACGQIMQ